MINSDGLEIYKDTLCVGLGPLPSTGMGGPKTVRIPEGITEIEEGAFAHYPDLQSVTLPSTLEYIGTTAFKGSSLTEVHIPDGMVKGGVASLAFSDCPKLTKLIVNYERTVRNIYNSAFNGTPLKEVVIAGVSYPCFTGAYDHKLYITGGYIRAVGQSGAGVADLVARVQLWYDAFKLIPNEELLGDLGLSAKNAPLPSSINNLVELRLGGLI